VSCPTSTHVCSTVRQSYHSRGKQEDRNPRDNGRATSQADEHRDNLERCHVENTKPEEPQGVEGGPNQQKRPYATNEQDRQCHRHKTWYLDSPQRTTA